MTTALALAAALAACGGSGSATGPQAARDPLPLAALEVTVTAGASTVAGEAVTPVEVRVLNRSARPVVVSGSGTCTVRAVERDAGGVLTEQARTRGCTRDCRAFVFEPGQAYVRQDRFGARVWSQSAQREVARPAGEYQIAGRVEGYLGDGCPGTMVATEGAPVRVRVE